MSEHSKKQKKEKYFKWLWSFTKGVRHLLFFQTLFSIVMALGGFVGIYATIGIVDIALGEGEGGIAFFAILAAIGTILICVAIYAGSIIGRLSFNRLQLKLREYIIRRFYSRKYRDMQKKHTAELMTLTTDDANDALSLIDFLSEGFVLNILFVFGSIALMFLINWQLATIIAATLPIAYFIMNGFSPIIERRSRQLTEAEENTRKNMHEGFSKALLFRAFSMIDKLTFKQANLQRLREKASVSRGKADAYHAQVNNVYNNLLTLMVYVVGGVFVARGTLTIGEVMGIMALRGNLYEPILGLNYFISIFSEARAGASRIRAVTELPDETTYPDTPIQKARSLAVEGLSFSYQDEYSDEEAILRDISLSFEPGKITAITGESGCGKSTLAKVIMGFYAPYAGVVKLKDAEGCFTSNILAHVAYVPPTDYVFNGSIAENICMTHDIRDGAMQESATAAGIHDFITTLPEGYDTVIGEGATELSSGQGQRVAIARALYQNSDVIIFDEPTSNLDKDSIAVLHETLKQLSKSKICVVITHDKATMDVCDEVYKLENGNAIMA